MNLFNNFRRVSAEHILDLSIGTDARGNQAMLLVSSIKPTKLDVTIQSQSMRPAQN